MVDFLHISACVCVWRTEYLRQSPALQLNRYQGAGDAQHCTNSLFLSLPLGWFDHLLLFSDTSYTTKREKTRFVSGNEPEMETGEEK